MAYTRIARFSPRVLVVEIIFVTLIFSVVFAFNRMANELLDRYLRLTNGDFLGYFLYVIMLFLVTLLFGLVVYYYNPELQWVGLFASEPSVKRKDLTDKEI